MAWVLLIIGGLFEIGFTTCLRQVDGFRNIPWTLGFLVSIALSMALLQVASRSIPMGTAYAVWVGIGASLTVIWAMITGDSDVSWIRIALILGLVGCIVGLKLIDPGHS